MLIHQIGEIADARFAHVHLVPEQKDGRVPAPERGERLPYQEPRGLAVVSGAGERKHRPLRPVDSGEVAVDVVEIGNSVILHAEHSKKISEIFQFGYCI